MSENVFNLDSFLDQFQNEKTGSDNPTPEVNDEEKVAALVEEGQIVARAFFDELSKLAVETKGQGVDTGPVKDPDKLNAVPTGDLEKDKVLVSKADAIIANLTKNVHAGGGEILMGSNQMDGSPSVPDANPIPADMAKAQVQAAAAKTASLDKEAADKIVTNLYNKYFGGDE